MVKLTTEDFIKKARSIHGDKYDYSKVNYINCDTKVCIICPIHGEFWQIPSSHLNGNGCPICGKLKSNSSKTMGLNDFIEKARKKHGDKYDYSKVEYVNNRTKVCIICPKHGEFWQEPSSHLVGRGCKLCFEEKKKHIYNTTQEDFINKCKTIHGDKYDYSKVIYTNAKDKICIMCPEHGEFWQEPSSHLNGCGCPKCAKITRSEKKTLTKDTFMENSQKKHGNKYNYSKVEYTNARDKVCIICPEHGEF